MAQPPPPGYPPPPGGAPPYDPYASDRALAAWAAERGYAISTTPDLAWFQAWSPFSYLPRAHRVVREVRATFGEVCVWVVEWFEDDPVKQATGEDRHLVALATSPRLAGRAALRSKSGGGVVQEISSGLGSLFGGKPAGSVLGDPTLEGRFDVAVPSREEGDRALPMALRQLLVGASFRGIVEVRPGGLAMTDWTLRAFDGPTIDALVHRVGQVHHTATDGAR